LQQLTSNRISYRKPIIRKTQLNVENEFISSEISQNKESAVERGSKIIIVKKKQRAWIKEYE